MDHPATLQTLGMNNTVCHILPQEGPTVYTGLPPLPLHNETIPCSTLTPILKPQQMQGTFYGLPFTLTGFTQQNHPLFHLPSPQLLLYTSGLCLLTHEYRCSPTYKHLEIGTWIPGTSSRKCKFCLSLQHRFKFIACIHHLVPCLSTIHA